MPKELWIDRRSPVPLHEQCKQLLLQQIRLGKLQPGDTIPPERELEQLYGLSRTTIRQAILELVQQGVLQRVQGRGTFVAKTAIPFDLHHLTSFTEDMRARGKRPSSRLLELSVIPADPTIRDALVCNTVIKIKRLRLADDKPMGIHTAFLPDAFKVDETSLNQEGSLYAILSRRHHLELFTADETLEAVTANEEESQLLGIVPGAPVLRIERLSYDSRGEPREFVVMRYRADEYKYYVRLTR
jgi:GntR family transcriptional regulator